LLTLTISGICNVVTMRANRALTIAALLIRAYYCLCRIVVRFDRLLIRFHAGTLPKPRRAPLPPALPHARHPPPASPAPAQSPRHPIAAAASHSKAKPSLPPETRIPADEAHLPRRLSPAISPAPIFSHLMPSTAARPKGFYIEIIIGNAI